jgi:hypothetical protein
MGEHTFHAHIVDNRTDETTEVLFSRRQGAIEYVWPFYKRVRRSTNTYAIKIIRDKGTPAEKHLYPPAF